MKLIVKFGESISVDLMMIKTIDFYQALNTYSKQEREFAAQDMMKKYSKHHIMQGITSLFRLFFQINGPLFTPKIFGNFLADMIRAYVDQYDGAALAAAFDKNNIFSLRTFKFSQHSVELYTALWKIANNYCVTPYDQIQVDFLPANFSNNIWQPIIYTRQSHDPDLDQGLKKLASNRSLQRDIFMSNITVGILKPSGAHALRPKHRVTFFISEVVSDDRFTVRAIEELCLNLKTQLLDELPLELASFEKKANSKAKKLFLSQLQVLQLEALTLLSWGNYEAAKSTTDLVRTLINAILIFDVNGHEPHFKQACIDSFKILHEQLQTIPDFSKKTAVFQVLAEAIVKMRVGIFTVDELICPMDRITLHQ